MGASRSALLRQGRSAFAKEGLLVGESPQIEPFRYWADKRQRQKRRRCVECRWQRPSLVRREPDQRLHYRDQHCDDNLAPSPAHYSAWISDHEENEQLIHRSGNRSDLRQHWLAERYGANAVEEQKARDIRERDVKNADTRGDDQSEDPDHQVRRHIVAELVAEH